MFRALVVGASGQVGGAIMEALGDRAVGTYSSQAVPEMREFHLEQAAENDSAVHALLDATGPDVVVIAAGFTWVDGCEREPRRAMILNCDGPGALARVAAERGLRTVYLSTEYVFDGEHGPYSEEDPPRPLSVYGRSKLEGERAVLAASPANLVVRTTVVYGPERQGKNFAYQLIAKLAAGEPFRAPADQLSSPTYNRDLAGAILGLLERGASGVYHVVGPEVMDRATLARRLARSSGFDDRSIVGVTTADMGQEAPRPLAAGLVLEKLRRTAPDVWMRSVEEATAHWLLHPGGRSWPT